MPPFIVLDLFDGSFGLSISQRTGMTDVSEGRRLLGGISPLQKLDKGRMIKFHGELRHRIALIDDNKQDGDLN